MRKYKKMITGLILALICAILPFVGVAKAKALTSDEITTINDLKNTKWQLNNVLNAPGQELVNNPYIPNDTSTKYVDQTISGDFVFGIIELYDNQQIIPLLPASQTLPLGKYIMSFNDTLWNIYVELTEGSETGEAVSIYNFETKEKLLNPNATYYLQFGNFPDNIISAFTGNLGTWDFVTWLKQNATLVLPEPTTRTIPFKIGVILGNSGTAQTDEIYLPFNDDTVSFTVDFTPTKLINGQISKAPGEDMRELIFQNGKKIFYTVYYNDDNVDFKLNFYGEELQVFLAVMHNTINQDNEGNYLPASQTYTSGLTSTDIDNLNNTGVYSASFEIQIPPENELVSRHFLELRIGINPYVNDEENNENISNIMTGIFTLISSFLSIQLGFITLGQLIGLILAIGVIFFIFYVWNGGRNGN